MGKVFWQNRWHENDIKFNQAAPNAFLQRYWKNLAVDKQARVLVPLCGKSIDMLWIARQGHEVIGVELSNIACEAFFKENNLPFITRKQNNFDVYQGDNITLFAGDFFELTQEMTGKLDAVFDRAALYALPSTMRQVYVDVLKNLLAPQAMMLLISLCYDQREMEGPPFSVDEKEVHQLYASHFSINKLYDADVTEIMPHHKQRGLSKAKDMVYLLQANKATE